jgi:membrane-associated phospholipid phosphatase
MRIAAGALQSVDEALTRPLTLPARPGLARGLATTLAHSGDIYIWVGLMVLAWFFAGEQWRAPAAVVVAGLAVAEVAVVGIKTIVRRKRPPGTGGGIYRKVDPYSFPSGHAARATMLCILAWHFGPAGAFIGILAWSPIMVLSRIAIGIHYVFDVLAGALLGWLLTVLLLALVPLVARWL